MEKSSLKFYLEQGVRTEVREGVFNDFPDDVEEIVKIIQGLLVHADSLESYGLEFSEDRLKDWEIAFLQKSIDRIMEIEDKSLIDYREPKNRVYNNCRHFSMFLSSVLRSKGIPARCRCGFANYLQNGWFEDHWICEYWNGARWVRVDSMIDDLHISMCDIDVDRVNPFDLPKESFFSAAVMWIMYRRGFVSGELCGFSLEKEECGDWYIRGNLMRDFFGLNKVEYTYKEKTNLMDRDYVCSDEDLKLLDEIADLIVSNDFEGIRKLYEERKDLRPDDSMIF